MHTNPSELRLLALSSPPAELPVSVGLVGKRAEVSADVSSKGSRSQVSWFRREEWVSKENLTVYAE